MTESPEPAQPRRVDWRRAFAWYGDALRWLKLSPVMLLVLAFLTLAIEYLLQQVTGGGMLVSKVVTPLVACSLYVACDRVAAGGKARWSDLLAAFRVSAPSIAAIVLTSLIEFVAEATTADSLSGLNLFLDSGADDDDAPDLETVVAMFAVGFAVSLPFTLTPFFALLDDAGFGGSIRPSVQAFFANVPAFLCYGLLSFLLLLIGIALMGVGVIVAMPLWVAASYAALRDIYPRDATFVATP